MVSNDERPEALELSDFLHDFNEESDRGMALVAASLLDERLKGIIEAFLFEQSQSQQLSGAGLRFYYVY